MNNMCELWFLSCGIEEFFEFCRMSKNRGEGQKGGEQRKHTLSSPSRVVVDLALAVCSMMLGDNEVVL